MAAAWTAYLAILAASACVQAICVSGLFIAVTRNLRRLWARRRSGGLSTVAEGVAVIVPCYLPNEAPIIEGTLRHLLHELVGVKKMDVYLIYNTPKDMPEMEAKLVALAQEAQPPGRRLFVQRVHGSKSKADNLNHIIPQLAAAEWPFTAVYDADHHPDPGSLQLAVNHMQETGADCVQGSTYVREGFWLLRYLICAEFFMTYFVMLPVQQAVTGTGFFGGANAIWSTESLQKLAFDPDALTEDIECFARATLEQGLTFTFLPECCSGELLPSGLRAFWKQRLRWAMGWDQVTTRHAPLFSQLPLRRRVALYYIFVFRWFSQLCATIVVLINISAVIHGIFLGRLSSQDTPPEIQRLQKCSFYLFLVTGCYAFVRGVIHDRRLIVGLWIYFSCMPGYVIFGCILTLTSLSRLATGNLGEWVVTSRNIASSSQASAPSDSAAVPLLNALKAEPTKGARLCVSFLMAFGFIAQGGALGALVGYVLGQHEVSKPLWGWVPLGIGAENVYVMDQRVMTYGFLYGLACGALMLLFFWARGEMKQNWPATGIDTPTLRSNLNMPDSPPAQSSMHRTSSPAEADAQARERELQLRGDLAAAEQARDAAHSAAQEADLQTREMEQHLRGELAASKHNQEEADAEARELEQQVRDELAAAKRAHEIPHGPPDAAGPAGAPGPPAAADYDRLATC